MRLIISTFFCALLIALASASGSGSGTNSSCTTDGVSCRIVVNSNQVYALAPNNFDSTSSAAIVMRYDLTLDPTENNQVLPWIGGVDPFGLTAYDYTRPTGCLGCNGPLGYSGPLGSVGNLPNRFHGHTPNNRTHTYANNWCPQANDSTCVYGFAGPLGEKGPLNPYAYYNTMYHLGEGVNWSQDYNINLDSAGIWGVQGPLGATGAFGALGALGPLGFSKQAGVTTLATGVYKVNNVVVRQTSPVQYSADGTISRIYDLYEMYTKDFALKMTDNDCSFAVDSYQSNPGSKGDGFLFTSNATQWLSINVVPVNLLDDFGLILAVSVDGGSTFSIVSEATSNPYSSSGGLMDFIVTRARPNELFRVTVFQQTNGAPVESGYYLYVAGSGVIEIDSNGAAQTVDLWGPRPQLNGTSAFNINGAHQAWIPF